MWIFPKIQGLGARLNWGLPFSFRAKLTLLLMLVVVTVTILALYFTQKAAQTAYLGGLQDKFKSRIGFLLGAQDTREAQVSEQCRSLAHVVRIQAALEEGDVEDLYANARIELRNVLDEGNAQAPGSSPLPPRATFFRFLNAEGKLLVPPSSQAKLEAWEEQLVAVGLTAGSQQVGYVAFEKANGTTEINEVVATPILREDDGTRLGTLVLGFPPLDVAIKPDAELQTGIWLDGQLQMPALTATEREALSTSMSKIIPGAPLSDNNFRVWIQGEPYLLFYKILNPGSQFTPAYEICLYSLAGSLASQQRLRWKIVGGAVLVLLIGLGASHLFSARLSRPVEELAEVSAQNVVRREEAEAAREMTEQKYRSIFENAVEGIFLLAPDGRCLSANPAMARIFGYDSPEQFVVEAANWVGSLYVEPEQGIEFLQRVKTEGSISNFECGVKRRNGSIIWISQNARAVRDVTGSLLHLEGTLEDITARKQAADSLRTLNADLKKALSELKATQNQVIQQERLRALGQMASGIAHDFNNSLMPVMGFTELLLAQPGILNDKKKAVEYLEVIRTAAKDAASIVSRLREFYRTNENSDVFTPVDISALARQVVSLTEPKWKGQAQASGAEIRFIEEFGKVPPIAGDESALREVFTNLIFNAVDAMPRGGSITFRTRCENKKVVVEISDTGAGMSEEVRQRCLEPFFTTKGERGTGLGLAMVFGIVQRHGGTIDLHTMLGQGTTFILSFPFHAKANGIIAPKAAPLPSQRALHVLLVDDEPPVCQVLTAFLAVDGHSVQSAGDGIEGLRLFREGKFDLVITDKAIPGMSGDQMAMEIKRVSPNIPIVLLSGFNSSGENEKIPGVDVIASKPITMPALREAIRKAMEAA